MVSNDGGLAFCQIEAYRMALETVDTPLALLQIHWVAGKIPVADAITIRMEVETFLTHGCRGKNKRSER